MLGCRGRTGRSFVPGIMKSGGVQSSESGFERFFSVTSRIYLRIRMALL